MSFRSGKVGWNVGDDRHAHLNTAVSSSKPGSGRLRSMAVILWLVTVALALAELWMIAVTLDRPAPDQWGFRGFEAALALSFGSVGALIAARRPENRIGWLLLGVGVVTGVQGFVDQYPVLAKAVSPAPPFVEASRWVAAWIWVIPSIALMTFLPLLFPDGRLLSPRWRLAVLLAVAAMAVQIGSIVLATQPLGPLPPTQNPAAYFERFGPRMAIGYVIQLAAISVAVISVVLRYRRARGEERQQIKWVVYAVVLIPFGAAAGFSTIFLGQVLLIGTGVFAAAAIAIAILRYRLYEIDVIINRTLVYGALSAVLAGVYTASITLSQRLFMAVTGERSDAAIVLTTLIVAATFTSLKTRLQSIVDARVRAAPPAGASAPATVGAGPDPLHMLGQLAELYTAGALTAGEFRAKKAELLSRV